MTCSHCQLPIGTAPSCESCRRWLTTQRLEANDARLGEALAGRFRILGVLGEGGMGRVYLAEQSMGRSSRKVAVKTLQARYANDPTLVARFERECALVGQLEHPNTIQFFDFGQTETGELFIVMEYVEGHSLAEVLAHGGPLPPERVAFVLQQIAGALEEAHALGIVHRDLKPSNVMLTTRAGRADFVKVLDFGIAKRIPASGRTESHLTQEGALLGTPPYMSPEQFRGVAEPDLRSDIYSLALIAYEMLTGSRPFSAKTPWEWATAHMGKQPLPFELHEAGAHLPYPMKQAILKALSKDPNHRQTSARAFVEELMGGRSVTPAWHFQQPMGAVTEAMGSSLPRALPLNTVYEAPPAASTKAVFVPPAPPRRAKEGSHSVRKVLGFVVVAILSVPLFLFILIGSGAFSREPPRPEVTPSQPGVAPSLPSPPPSPSPSPRPPEQSCPNGMVDIDEGSFWMGSNEGDADERPVHRATVAAFCLDETEVTVSAYAECVGSGACSSVGETVHWAGVSESDRGFWSQFCNHDEYAEGDHPVSCVDWEQANAYCRYRGKRLPSEEEWEYAAKNGEQGRTYPWGEATPSAFLLNACGSECASHFSDLGRPQRAMHGGDDGWKDSAPVRSYPQGRSAHGLYDMAGNVWEWTASRACDYPKKSCTDSRRVCRGGTWFNNAAANVRAANRYMVAPSARSFDIGFRCAKGR